MAKKKAATTAKKKPVPKKTGGRRTEAGSQKKTAKKKAVGRRHEAGGPKKKRPKSGASDKLSGLGVPELKALAKKAGVAKYYVLRRDGLLKALAKKARGTRQPASGKNNSACKKSVKGGKTKKKPVKKKASRRGSGQAAKKAPAKKTVRKRVAKTASPPGKKDSGEDGSELKCPVVKFDVPVNTGLHPEIAAKRLVGRPRKYKPSDAGKVAGIFEAYAKDCRGRMRLDVVRGSLMEVPAPDPLTIMGVCLALRICHKTFDRWLEDREEGEAYDALHEVAVRIKQVITQDAMRLAHGSKTSRGATLHLCSLGFKMRTDMTSDDKPVNPLGQMMGEIDGSGFSLPGDDDGQ